MTGLQATTISPSSSSSRRSTPWVDGCWGPMLMWSVCFGGVIPNTEPLGPINFSRHREVHGLTADRLVATKRVARPVVGQHDPSQVGVTGEAHTKEVVDLTLVPIGAGEDRRNARGVGSGAGFQPQPGVFAQRVEKVLQVEAIISLGIVDRRQIDEAAEAVLISEHHGDLGDLLDANTQVRNAIGGRAALGRRAGNLEPLQSLSHRRSRP